MIDLRKRGNKRLVCKLLTTWRQKAIPREIKCKMKIGKSNGLPDLQLFSYRNPRKNILKINLLLLLAIFPCFFVAAFHFLVIFSQVVRLSPHNVKNNVATFRAELVKCDKSRTRLFILSKQTFPSQYVKFLKQPIYVPSYRRKNEEH